MATIKASWRRVVSVRPYETETFELSVEMDGVGDGKNEATEGAAELYRDLATQGDQLIAERYGRNEPPVGPQKPPARPTYPDPFTR